MSLNSTPSAQRIHIAFFGCRNAGKSSLINAVTGQNLSIVSEVKGTTTDPVEKAMELLPLGPVRIIDTPGIDDEGKLGLLRIQKTRQVLDKTDLAVLVVDGKTGTTFSDRQLLKLFQEKNIPYLVVYNKKDLWSNPPEPVSYTHLLPKKYRLQSMESLIPSTTSAGNPTADISR